MLLANLKVELKLRWMNHCALATVSLDEANASSNNIFFTIKCTNLCVVVVTLSAKINQELSDKNLAKGLKGECITINIKQKVKWELRQTVIDIFLNLLELADCLC